MSDTKPKTMSQTIKKYPVVVVESATDPVSKETCGGDQYTLVTSYSKGSAFAIAKCLTEEYEVHVYEETSTDVQGHWIFKNGVMTHNMFNN